MAAVVNVDPANPRQEALEEAAAHLKLGRLAGIPTETFYGIAADALNEAAVEKVFSLKRRAKNLPLPIIADSLAMLETVAEVNQALCKGCGTCAATCPSECITLFGFSHKQIYTQVDEALKELEAEMAEAAGA